MSTSNWKKFKLLLWKNWLLQWCHKIQTMVQLLLPLVFASLLIFIRTKWTPTNIPDVNYVPEMITDISNLQYILSSYITNKTVKMELVYSPQNVVLENIIRTAAEGLEIAYKGLPNSASLEEYLMTEDDVLAGAEFDNSLKSITEYPKQLKYSIRFPSELRTYPFYSVATWETGRMFPVVDYGGPRNLLANDGGLPVGYIQEGFIAIQNAISTAFIRLTAQKKNINDNLPLIVMQRYPYPAYNYDLLLVHLGVFLSLIILLCFIYPSTIIVKSITLEKEKQLKEIMKIMGLQNWIHWSAWFLKSFVMLTLSMICVVIIIKIKFINNVAVLTYTNWLTLMVFLLVYIIAAITFCFMVSTFFSRASIASASTGLIWFVTYLPFILTRLRYDTMSTFGKCGLCLIFNTAMGYGFKLILLWEGTGEGLQWSNMFKPVSVDDNLTVGYIILLMLFAAVLQMIICLYVEQILPGEFGIPQVWYFPISKSFWFGEKKQEAVEDKKRIRRTRKHKNYFEKEPTGKRIGLEVKNLRKVFKEKVVVQGVSLNLYEDEITVLLGHNGAGKTTTISMIIGMFPPTSGTAIINGYDIRTNMEGARMSMAICPQHNILFDELTVRHHIIFYSRLKGVKEDEINVEVNKYVEKLKLKNKVNVASSKLSGGQQRKLSLCAALCGGTKVVLCDEPSSGMDPAARRQLWDLLQSEKSGRTILLTTHFMDEADVLGDRIAIMCDGEVKCHGTPFFLKKRLGSGYRLICVKDENCDSSKVTALLQTFIPNLKIENEIGTELVYLLPDKYSGVFGEMFNVMETNAKSLAISGFGISITSLEEVFMKVGAEKTFTMDNEDSKRYFKLVSSRNAILLDGFKRWQNLWQAMFYKKYLFTIRSNKVLAIQIFVPIIIVICSMLEAKASFLKQLAPLKINLKSYGEIVTILETAKDITDGSIEHKIANAYQLMMSNIPSQQRFISIKDDFAEYILELSKKMLTRVRKDYLVAATVSNDMIVAWFNNLAYHTAPLSLNLVHNAISRGIIEPSCTIDVTNSPLPFNAKTKLDQLNAGFNLGTVLSINLCFCMCFVSALYVLSTIKERECRAKLLQFVCGVKILTFWLTHMLWDMLIFFITSLLIVLTIVCFREDGYSTIADLGRLYLIFIIFGLAVMPMTYVVSQYFAEPSTGFAVLSIFNLFTGVGLSFLVSSLEDKEKTDKVLDAFNTICLIFPHYSFKNSLEKLYKNYQTRKICSHTTKIRLKNCKTVPYFDWKKPGILQEIVFMILCFFIASFFLLFKEFRCMENIMLKLKKEKPPRTQPSEDRYCDEDVEKEKLLIKNMSQADIISENLVLDRVTKHYGKFLAVNEVSVCIKGHECFGLLGVNGAGKTTTFKMMTGDERISSGEAYVCGYSLKSERAYAYEEIGYCPQFDALLDDLTGREMITIFCLIRGVRENRIFSTAEILGKAFGFARHLDKPTKAYSGGNKRKLSTAIAIIGSPSVIYLDEPTTGMDPAARRQLWNMIIGIRDFGKSIVLTTHSMEECEALCTRMTIMVNGEFKCIGSTQYLKNKFSKGLILKIKVKRITPSKTNLNKNDAFETSKPVIDTTAITEFVKNEFPEAVLQEQYQGILTFHIPVSTIKWSRIFGVMEDNLEKLNIEDYSINQTTLEEIFLDFAKLQKKDPREIDNE